MLVELARERSEGDVLVHERDGTTHRLVLRGGHVVSVRIAGRFDPLLETLHRAGLLRGPAFQATLEALARSERRAGALATEVGGVAGNRVRAALRAQTQKRLAALLTIAAERGSRARFVPRPVRPAEVAATVALASAPPADVRAPHLAPKAAPPPPAPTHAPSPPPDPQALARARLRRLAFALHPDRHAGLPPDRRAALAERLARATAAYHAL